MGKTSPETARNTSGLLLNSYTYLCRLRNSDARDTDMDSRRQLIVPIAYELTPRLLSPRGASKFIKGSARVETVRRIQKFISRGAGNR